MLKNLPVFRAIGKEIGTAKEEIRRENEGRAGLGKQFHGGKMQSTLAIKEAFEQNLNLSTRQNRDWLSCPA